MKRKYSTFILYLLFFVYLELVSKILMFNELPNIKFGIVVLFSSTIAFVFSGASSLSAISVAFAPASHIS